MSYLKIRKPPEYVLQSLRTCPVCGWNAFGAGRMTDLVHCQSCGSVFFISPGDVSNPVAKWVEKSDGNAA